MKEKCLPLSVFLTIGVLLGLVAFMLLGAGSDDDTGADSLADDDSANDDTAVGETGDDTVNDDTDADDDEPAEDESSPENTPTHSLVISDGGCGC